MMWRWLVLVSVMLLSACSSTSKTRPDNPENICAIFRQNDDWHEVAQDAAQRWHASIPVMMAMMYQESSYRHDAKPPMQYVLFVPTGRASSAYGYAQVKDETWADYKDQTGNSWANRDDFADAIDFMGWYTYKTNRVNRISMSDAYNQYLNYHEGWTGYRQGSHLRKNWLLKVSRLVDARAKRYAVQYQQCANSL